MVNGPLTVADLMSTVAIAVPGSETVETAIELVLKHNLKGLPVVEDGRLIGWVAPVHLLGQPLYRPVWEVMARGIVPATEDLSLSQAQALLARQRTEVLPVTGGDRVVGEISLATVLMATSAQIDPLTGLPWSTALRNWAGCALRRSHEVAVVFADLDEFRLINNVLGYIAADALLRAVAGLLNGLVDHSFDMLCRYGGDEFAIATTRQNAEARALAYRIRETVSLSIRMRGARCRLTTSLGLAGGRRVIRREHVHAAATVEDLLTLAKCAAVVAKTSKRDVNCHGAGEDVHGPDLSTNSRRSPPATAESTHPR